LLASVGLYDQVHVVRLHAEMNDAKAAARCLRERALQRGPDSTASQ